MGSSGGGGGIKVPSPNDLVKQVQRGKTPSSRTMLAGGPISPGGQYEMQKEAEKEAEINGLLGGVRTLSPRQIRKERNTDFAAGLKRGEQFFSEGALGRLNEARSNDLQSIIDQRREQANQGFGAQAFQAAREARLRGMGRSEQAAQRNLSSTLARVGVAGPLAGAQATELMRAQQAQRAQAEQDLFLQNVAQRQAALGSFESSLSQAEAGDISKQQFNLEQKNRELLGRLGLGLTEAQLGASERAGVRMGDVALASAQAQARAGSKK